MILRTDPDTEVLAVKLLRREGGGTGAGEWVEHGTGLTRFLSTKSSIDEQEALGCRSKSDYGPKILGSYRISG